MRGALIACILYAYIMYDLFINDYKICEYVLPYNCPLLNALYLFGDEHQPSKRWFVAQFIFVRFTCCLFFEIWILITPLVSSNSSYIKMLYHMIQTSEDIMHLPVFTLVFCLLRLTKVFPFTGLQNKRVLPGEWS